MANNAQNSQSKSDNLGRGRVAYAFKVSRVNPDFVSFKIWILGYYSKVCSIAVASLPKIVAQIDTALADGECEFEIGGIRFSADEKLLKSIREELSSYCCEGASDANHVPVNPPREVATESVKKCGAKQKASAPACKPSARQISNEERRTKNWAEKPPTPRKRKTILHSQFLILHSMPTGLFRPFVKPSVQNLRRFAQCSKNFRSRSRKWQFLPKAIPFCRFPNHRFRARSAGGRR